MTLYRWSIRVVLRSRRMVCALVPHDQLLPAISQALKRLNGAIRLTEFDNDPVVEERRKQISPSARRIKRRGAGASSPS
jgi:hypothetical protein